MRSGGIVKSIMSTCRHVLDVNLQLNIKFAELELRPISVITRLNEVHFRGNQPESTEVRGHLYPVVVAGKEV